MMTQIAARIPEEEKAEYIKYCEEKDITLSQLIRWAVREYLEKYRNTAL